MAWTSRAGGRSRRRRSGPTSDLAAGETTASTAPDPGASSERVASSSGARQRSGPLVDQVRSWAGTTLVLVAEPEALAALPDALSSAESEAGARVVHLWEHDLPTTWPADEEPAWQSVLLVTLDRATLRHSAAGMPDPGPVTDLGVWLAGHRQPVTLVPPPGWAPLRHLEARQLTRPGRGALLTLSFGRPVPARQVLQEVARQAVPTSLPDRSPLVTAYVGARPEPGLDPHAQVLDDLAAAVDPDRVVPPDVVVTPGPGSVFETPDVHPILARPPVVVAEPEVAPVDERVHSPRGWRRTPGKGDVDLADLLTHGVVTEQVVRRLRDHRAVRVDAATTTTHDLLALTMAGVPPLVTGQPRGLAPAVAELLVAPPDLDDALAREAWSVKLRRATFDHHSTLVRRHALATSAGVRGVSAGEGVSAALPGVSILLATKREHELEGAVARVAAQVGARVELVVATHGFEADPGRLGELLGTAPTLLSFGDDVLFGDVLTAAARAASHDVVMKMDDDDWYSPHTVHDLLMARRCSGADVVGSAAEFVHLEESDETLWRTNASECSTTFVAGGTMLLGRDLLREVGWFRPVRRWVDAQLLERVRASGGTIYRGHGLNYVLRRHGHGHTWAGDPDNFRAPGTLGHSWPGFRPPQEAL